MHTYTTGTHNSVVVSAHILQVREYSTPVLVPTPDTGIGIGAFLVLMKVLPKKVLHPKSENSNSLPPSNTPQHERATAPRRPQRACDKSRRGPVEGGQGETPPDEK